MGKKKISVAAPELLSTEQAADLLGLDPSMVRRYAAAGSLPGQRIGDRAWVFVRSVVTGWTPPRKVGRPRKPTGDSA